MANARVAPRRSPSSPIAWFLSSTPYHSSHLRRSKGLRPRLAPRLPRAEEGDGAGRTSSPGRSAVKEQALADHGLEVTVVRRGSVEARCDATRAGERQRPFRVPPLESWLVRWVYPPTGLRVPDRGGVERRLQRGSESRPTVRSTRTCSSAGRTRLLWSEEFPLRCTGGRGPRRPR